MQHNKKKPNLFKTYRLGEEFIRVFLFLCATISIITTLSIVFILGKESFLLFTTVYETQGGNASAQISLLGFFTDIVWQPAILRVGIWPLLTSTLVISFIAILVALPIGLGAAAYLSEYATPRTRRILKPSLELLAGIPTVVYGYFALTFVTPLLQTIFGKSTFGVYNMASAGIVMGIMIIPLIASLSEDALHAVPQSLREAAYGLGATDFEVTTQVIFPAAFSGIVAAFTLAVSRAIGETMIVAIAAGAGPNLTLDPRQAAETMTGYIARISTGDLSYNTLDYNSIFALAFMLFIFTFTLNLISSYVARRYREVYE
ncbi:MAG: phosphate ABC transporter permease subunit PstC [Anaerolineae bacterium]|nr:phosphate ABC transporter permease subunit PstC [Anaerolineae bacterium]MDQ7034915.1 phosphate ABC transporter permease subunit PstC [Anaerolineae bacterium]